MYTLKQTLIWTALMCVTAWGQESESQAKAPKLSFEVSEQTLSYPPREGRLMPTLYDMADIVDKPKPFAYAAAISTNGSISFRSFGGEDRDRRRYTARVLKSISEKQDISNAQKAFLLKGDLEEKTIVASYRIIEDPQPSRQLLLYAVSIEDAKKMAQAYYDNAYSRLEQSRGKIKREIDRYAQEMANHQKELAEVQRILQNAEPEFEDLKKKVPYRSTQEAKAALAEFNRMLNALTVEISGIEATIKAIDDYRSDKRTSPQLLIRLEDMLIEEAIKRTAAEAREKTASALQTNATKYIDLQAKILNRTQQRNELTETVSRRQRQQERETSNLENMVVPQILNNKVTIYPVNGY